MGSNSRARLMVGREGLPAFSTRRQAQERVHDALTGHGARSVGVILLDLDEFARINDSLGHDAGDEVLAVVGRRLDTIVRRGRHTGDLVARLGGDEYAVVCTHVACPAELATLAERIQRCVSRPVRVGDRDIVVSASLGLAVGTPGVDSPPDLLRYASAAAFRAKRSGRARYEFSDPADPAVTRLDLELQLRRALVNDELVLHYQPVVDARRRIVAVEALVRWQHPRRGLLRPDAFLHATTATDLSASLDRWVLGAACAQLAQWHRALRPRRLTMAVNVGPANLLRADCASTVRELLDTAGLQPGDLCLELPETQLSDVVAANDVAALRRLRDLGVRLALDDFGVGRFTLSHLKELPTDVLKVDRSLVRNVGQDRVDTSIVRAVVSMAHATGRVCVAEGVEDDRQWQTLVEMGCDQFQGFHLGRPAGAAAVSRTLETSR